MWQKRSAGFPGREITLCGNRCEAVSAVELRAGCWLGTTAQIFSSRTWIGASVEEARASESREAFL